MTENHNIIPARHIHEECGVFGIFTPQEADVASYAYYALYSLQHRGQESAGIVVNDDGLFRSLRDTGLVSEVFPPEQLKSLGQGTIAVGHVRYGTTGSDNKRNPAHLSEPLQGPYGARAQRQSDEFPRAEAGA